MKKIPDNVKKVINEFIIKVNNILGSRVKKLYFMALTLGEISIKAQTLIL